MFEGTVILGIFQSRKQLYSQPCSSICPSLRDTLSLKVIKSQSTLVISQLYSLSTLLISQLYSLVNFGHQLTLVMNQLQSLINFSQQLTIDLSHQLTIDFSHQTTLVINCKGQGLGITLSSLLSRSTKDKLSRSPLDPWSLKL